MKPGVPVAAVSVRRVLVAMVSFCIALGWSLQAQAIEVRSEYFEANPLRPAHIYVHISGGIEDGDKNKVADEIGKYAGKRYDDILFLYDSPGGSLVEGVAIGRYISKLPVTTNAQVGDLKNPDAICASACVYAFIGSNYRYLGSNGRIGVHRFYPTNENLSGAAALDMSQSLSALIAVHLREMNVEPEFLDDIMGAAPDDIAWVDAKRLKEVHVLTDAVNDETVQYHNVNGQLALTIRQNASTGLSIVTLLCGEKGLVAVVDLTEPEFAVMGPMELVIDDEGYRVADPDILGRSDKRLKAAMNVPAGAAKAMLAHGNVGVRMIAPSGDIFFGFNGTVKDDKIAETVRGCRTQPLEILTMERHPGIDIQGGDLTTSGFKGVSLNDCESLCMADRSCVGTSYISLKQWCWPKNGSGEISKKSGVISSIKPRS